MEDMEVSINAILGLVSDNSMKLLEKMASFSIDILVDSGSTHNFLDPSVASAVNLNVKTDSVIEVKVANVQNLSSKGYGQKVINIQGTKFLIIFHILPFGGCDIVLGVEWLKNLGPIKWNFANMSIQFLFKGGEFNLQGINSTEV